MLRELHISGLGVIDDLDLELHPGLNVLTGETGTGKTMVTVGLQLALGRRGGSSLVREGAPAAKVQARFDAPPSAVSAGWAEDDEVLLARTVTADGRSTARVGGQLAPVIAVNGLDPEIGRSLWVGACPRKHDKIPIRRDAGELLQSRQRGDNLNPQIRARRRCTPHHPDRNCRRQHACAGQGRD